jgi:uncharacterized membrane protein (DUF485 family)
MPDPGPNRYGEIARSDSFRRLLAAKQRFVIPMALFFFAFYFTLPILTSYSHVLNHRAIGSISWAWVFAFAQFVMTWTLSGIYTRRAAQFDDMAQEIVAEVSK